MKTRLRLTLSVILLGLLAAYWTPTPTFSAPPKSASAPAKGKPNIVLILTDDLDSEEIQYMPKLKLLITDQGVTFRNYLVSMSLCCPSRSSTLRGQYAHDTQILGNHPPNGGFGKFYQLGEEKSTIATWLQDAGYRTMLAGKYLNGYPHKDNPMYIPPGWNEWYSPAEGSPYSEYDYTLNENGQQMAYGKKPEDYGTDVYVGKTVDFIKRAAKEGKPFFAYLAPYAPHAPYTPAPRHKDLFPGVQAPRTPNYDEADVNDKPDYIRNRPLLKEPQKNRIDQAYRKRLQALQAVDEGIEAIVNTLKANGQLDNTYIFFTSDNGYHLGNHREVLGKISPYEEELRVTMMVRGPGVPAGQTREQLAGNIDLAPTWAALAGAKTPEFVDGRSLVPLMGDNPPELNQWRQEFAIENGVEREPSGIETPVPTTEEGLLEPEDQDQTDTGAVPAKQRKALAPPAFRGIRLQTWSYVEYVTGEKELYDIRADPYQLQNLAPKADPKVLEQLSARVEEMMTCKAAACRTAEDAPFNPPLGSPARSSTTHTDLKSAAGSSGGLIAVDFTAPVARPSLAGILLGIHKKSPPPLEWAQALAPRLWRGNAETIDYALQAGAKFDMLTSSPWKKPSEGGAWPYGNDPKNPDWSAYERFLTDFIRRNKTGPGYWEFWNEPDLSVSWPQSRPDQDRVRPCPTSFGDDLYQSLLLETYAHFYKIVRQELGPEAMVVAPSSNYYCLAFLRKFLDYAVDHQFEVNVLAWHELGLSQDDLPSIEAHLKEARAQFFYDPAKPATSKYKALNLKEIHINETVGPAHTFHPGDAMAYLYFTERGGADYVGRSCFADASDTVGGNTKFGGCFNNTMDSVLVPLKPGDPPGSPRQPRAVWWMYKAYGELAGQRVPCEPGNATTVCLAGLAGADQAKVLVGSFAADGAAPAALDVELKGLRGQPQFAAAQRLHVKIEQLAQGQAAVTALPVAQEVDLPFPQESLRLSLPPLAPHDGMIVTVTT